MSLLAVTVSQARLSFDDLDSLRSIGQLFYRISLYWDWSEFFSHNYSVVKSLRDADQRGEVLFSSYHFKGTYY